MKYGRGHAQSRRPAKTNSLEQSQSEVTMSSGYGYDTPRTERLTRVKRRPGRLKSQEYEPCTICLERITDPGHCDPCMHVFCIGCIRKWLREKHECPQCRQRLYGVIFNVRSADDYDELLIAAPQQRSLYRLRMMYPSFFAQQNEMPSTTRSSERHTQTAEQPNKDDTQNQSGSSQPVSPRTYPPYWQANYSPFAARMASMNPYYMDYYDYYNQFANHYPW